MGIFPKPLPSKENIAKDTKSQLRIKNTGQEFETLALITV